jgi:amino acid transporter
MDPRTVQAAMNVWSVTALGIGSMVGAGIFALLGQATLLAGRDVLLSFLIGGAIALLAGYSFARLSARYPGRGGLIDYLAEAFPKGLFAGTLSLVYLVTLIVTVAVVGKSFGAYGAQLIFGEGAGHAMANALAVLMVLAIALINLVGSGAVGRAELLLVVIKLGILVLLIVASLSGFNSSILAKWPSVGWTTLTASVGLTFFAYAGFGMMANAAASVSDPRKVMPRALFLAISLVILLYLALALVILGNLPADRLAHYADTAVAAAAKPVLGQIGYTIVAIGGLLATASATNATMFSILNLNADLSQRGKLPHSFDRSEFHAPLGFLIALAISLALILAFPLGAIANLAGVTFLIAYLAVFAAHWRLRKTAGGIRLLIVLGAVLMTGVLLGSLVHLGREQPPGLLLICLMLIICAASEWLIGREERRPPSNSSMQE